MHMKKIIPVLLILAVIAISGCVQQEASEKELPESGEKSLDILLEETLNAEVPSYTKVIDVTIVKSDDNLTIEYIAYASGFASGIYEHMKKVFVFLDGYFKEKGELYNRIELIAIGYQTGDRYTLEITQEELSEFVSGELDFEQWTDMIEVKKYD